VKDAAARLTTTRLELRRVTRADTPWLERLHADPRVMAHVGGVLTPEGSAKVVRERMLDYYDPHPGLGIWATIERASGRPVGCHLLNNLRGETLIQVGYLLFPEYWGRGYATEMCLAVLRYGYVELGLERIHAITDLPHLASQRVLLKAGLQRHGERSFPAYAAGAPLAFFQRDAADWLAEQGAR
jgi:[ribosomal protein S5]-alanine N-acetyltransferase